MILSATFSKPASLLVLQNTFCAIYKKVRIRLDTASSENTKYFCEMFTEKQVFHKKMTEAELAGFIEDHAGKTFKNCVVRTEEKEITYLANKKGKITKLEKMLKQPEPEAMFSGSATQRLLTPLRPLSEGKKKNYLLEEGVPVPFLVRTGIMTTQGKVVASRYDKFRQINRFLEFIDDILPDVLKQIPEDEPIRIADFGCGKSYLTFAVHYFLTKIKHLPCEIEGLDLKKDVIDYCNKIVRELELEGICFSTGDISEYSGEKAPDIVITLHACDTATDFALEYAVSKNAKAILSVPCCQHEVNKQLQENRAGLRTENNPFGSLLKWGIIREKFSSLVTDAIRGEYLEQKGYKVQMLEFIDMEHTPKNILIRAVRSNAASGALGNSENTRKELSSNAQSLISALGINPEIVQNSEKN